MTTSPSASTAPPEIAANHDVVLVVDFGSQTAQLIARRIRDAGTLAFLVSPNASIDELRDYNPKGLVLSGGPASVYDDGAPRCNPDIFDLGVPILGICYGLQAACLALGGHVSPARHREFGSSQLTLAGSHPILKGVPDHTTVWMSHGDQIEELSTDFQTLGGTASCPHAIVAHNTRPFFGVQFHPEVTHTPHGQDILRNFLTDVCTCSGNWSMADFRDEQIAMVRERVGDGRVLCGLSGGVDSSVTAALLAEALGDRLSCVFVDNGLLRKNERDRVEAAFASAFDVDLHVEDAEAAFLADLAGIDEPQEKRRRIGHRFIEVFKKAAAELERERDPFAFLAQGTLYPDVIESGHGYSGSSANIKLHHNVGGLPAELGFDLIEPLRDLFKDEVRKLGAVLGLPDELVWRHPFPGPGLAVRVLGDITKPKLDTLREADEILLEEIIAADEYRKTAQVFAVLLPVNSVGVMGDARTYESVLAIRAVTTQDFMTADWARLPHDLLARISNRIINEVRGVNRVVYDISSKPPATIEWE